MTALDRPRFDLDQLRRLAGDRPFARGQAYYDNGHVEILALEPGRVLAHVAGGEDYRTEVTGAGKSIGGECSCPAFQRDWFCKHMVAVALAANAASENAANVGALPRIRAHLKERSREALVDLIVDLAVRDPALLRKLETAAAIVSADDRELETRLRKAIDNATRTKGFVDYYEAPGWAAGVGEVLDCIADLPSHGRADIAMKLAQRAIDRIERAIEDLDDSDGHCSELLSRARDIHLAAARIVRPEPVRLARDLFRREIEGDYGTFDRAAAIYADVLGEDGLAEYRRLATRAWDKLPARSGEQGDEDQPGATHDQLMDILDFFAERDGDVEARIALRCKDLSSPWRFLQLAEVCCSHGREEDALRWAEEGLRTVEDGRPDERLVLVCAELLAKAGRQGEAIARVEDAFGKAPSLALYTRLCELGGRAAGERAVKMLEAKLET